MVWTNISMDRVNSVQHGKGKDALELGVKRPGFALEDDKGSPRGSNTHPSLVRVEVSPKE